MYGCSSTPFFPTWEDVARLSDEIGRRQPPIVDEDLRGWSWDRETLVTPASDTLLGVSEVTSGFCEKGRDVYARRVLGVKGDDNPVLEMGRLVHEAFAESVSSVKKAVYMLYPDVSGGGVYTEVMRLLEEKTRGLEARYPLLDPGYAGWLYRRIWVKAALKYSAAVEELISRTPYMTLETLIAYAVPVMPEYPIDGSSIGLSRTLRVDAYIVPGILMELKTREPSPVYELSVAGYALAFESHYRIPVDYGLLVYVSLPEGVNDVIRVYPKLVSITAELRTAFLEERDKRHRIIMYQEDPGRPLKCSEACPFKARCPA